MLFEREQKAAHSKETRYNEKEARQNKVFPDQSVLNTVAPVVTEMQRLGYRWNSRDWAFWFRSAQEVTSLSMLERMYDEFRIAYVDIPESSSSLLPSSSGSATGIRVMKITLSMARSKGIEIPILCAFHEKIIEKMIADGW